MASPLIFKAPQCLLCFRRIVTFSDALSSPMRQQVRGKKKVAKVTTIPVQLRMNVAGYGKKGSIVPISRGMMRSTWFPRKVAAYVTVAQLGENVTVERDSTFESHKERKRARQLKESSRLDLDQASAMAGDPSLSAFPSLETAAPEQHPHRPLFKELFSPVDGDESSLFEQQGLVSEQTASLLSRLLPPNIEFYGVRAPAGPIPPPKKISRSLSAGAALSMEAEAAAAVVGADRTTLTPGDAELDKAITTADIAANLNAILASTEDGRGVIVLPESISFVGTKQIDAVKRLGTFTFEINLDDRVDVVRREITVLARK